MAGFWTDARLVFLLDCRAAGIPAAEAARQLSEQTGVAVSRSAVLGQWLRIGRARGCDPLEENRDGTLPAGWWRAGLARRGGDG